MTSQSFVFAVLAIVAGGTAFAGEATPDQPTACRSTVTRAQVDDQTLQARAAGLIQSGELAVVVAEQGQALRRAEAGAGTLEAIRVAAISRNEQDVLPTAARLENNRLAGQRALNVNVSVNVASL